MVPIGYADQTNTDSGGNLYGSPHHIGVGLAGAAGFTTARHQGYGQAQLAMSDVITRPAVVDDWLRATLRERWPHELLIGRGRVVDPAQLSALIAERGGDRLGLLTYIVSDEAVELVTLDALVPGAGAGRVLLDALANAAPALEARGVLAMVTNDNLRGLAYYQRAGFRLNALRPGAIEHLRKTKPWIPQTGQDGIPVRDEIDLLRPVLSR